jgi:hypothetical protein
VTNSIYTEGVKKKVKNAGKKRKEKIVKLSILEGFS